MKGQNDNNAIKQSILNSKLEFPKHIVISQAAKDLIIHLLQIDPKDRLGYGKDGPKKLRKHKWFKYLDWKAYVKKDFKPPSYFLKMIKRKMEMNQS